MADCRPGEVASYERHAATKGANLPQGSEGKTRDVLAEMAGMSGRTLDKVERTEREAIPGVFLTGISDRVSETLSAVKWRSFNGLETARRQGPVNFRQGIG